MSVEFMRVPSPPAPLPKRGEGGRGVVWFAALGLVSGLCLFVAVASGLGVVALIVRALIVWAWPVWMWWALAGLGALGLGMLSGWGWTRRYAVREWELEDREYALKDIRREVVEERVLVELAGPSVIRFALYDLISARLNVGEKATTRESFVARVKGQGFNGDDAWAKANKVLVVWGLKKPAPGRGWAEVSEQELRAGLVNVASLEINSSGSFAVWNGQMIRFDE